MSDVIAQSLPDGTKVSQPAGGFLLWVELPKPLDSGELFARALDRGICFAPGIVFSASGQHARCMRLSGGFRWDARIDKGLRTLGSMARQALG